MSHEKLYIQKAEIARHFPHLSKPQVMGLVIFSIGIILSERSTLTKVAEYLPMFGKPDTVERRLQRWLSNKKVDMEACLQSWISWVLSSCDMERLVLLVDETKLGKYLGIMMVGIPYKGRCIPLVWRCYHPKNYPEEGQVQLILGLLQQIKPFLPNSQPPVIEADRGIGTSADLMRGIHSLGWRFLMRVQNSSKVRTRKGYWRTLGQLVQPGEHWRGRGIVFKQRGKIDAFVHVLWRYGEKEAWCLVTNDPILRGENYALRNWQEQSFRDLKGGGWHWNVSQVWKPAHAERLILALALAYAWALTQGTFIMYGDKPLRNLVSRGKKRRFSIFREGLRYLKQVFLLDLPIYGGLFFAPDKPLC